MTRKKRGGIIAGGSAQNPAFSLRQGSIVEAAKGRMVIKGKGKSKLSLPQMLRGITKANRHPEQEW